MLLVWFWFWCLLRVLGVGAVRVFVVGGVCGDCVCGVGALRVACGGVLVGFSWVC